MRPRFRVIARRGDRLLIYRGRVLALALLAVLLAATITAAVTGYLMVGGPTTVLIAFAWFAYAFRLIKLAPAGPGGGPAPGGAGVREPRRPLPHAPAGAAMLPLSD